MLELIILFFVQLFDGWELNGNVIPSKTDHALPITSRQTTLCSQDMIEKDKVSKDRQYL